LNGPAENDNLSSTKASSVRASEVDNFDIRTKVSFT